MQRDTVAVLAAVRREFRDEQVTFMAASVAYYTFVSLLPLSLFALAVGTLLGGEAVAGYVVEAMGDLLAPAGRELVRDALVGAEGRGAATAVSLGLLLWTGLKTFRALDIAFSKVYGSSGVRSLVHQVVDAVTTLASIGAAVALVVLLGGVLPALPFVPFRDLVAAVSLPVGVTAALFPIFYQFPDVEMAPREAVPGTVFAGVGWSLLIGAFRVYAAGAGRYQLYGVLGAVLLLVTWLYVAAIVIILGGILNAVLAGRTDGDDGEPSPDTDEEPDEPAPDIVTLHRDVRELRTRLEERTVSRSALESDLRRYVRQRLRRGHARGWGPYLVLLYGTGMTLGAFYFLSGGWAILAMLVVWLSTLGLYALMLLVGVTAGAAGVPGRVADWMRSRRS